VNGDAEDGSAGLAAQTGHSILAHMIDRDFLLSVLDNRTA